MFRENLKGDFNIPSGKKKSVILYENDNLEKCSKQLKHSEILCADFEDIAKEAKMNDFIFLIVLMMIPSILIKQADSQKLIMKD